MPRWPRKKHTKYPLVRRARQHWTKPEHELFMEAVFQLYGCNWRLVTKHIKTRRQEQVRSHAQKIFEKMRAQGEGHLIPPRHCKKPKVVVAPPEVQEPLEAIYDPEDSPPPPQLPDFFPPLEAEDEADNRDSTCDIMSFFKDDAFY